MSRIIVLILKDLKIVNQHSVLCKIQVTFEQRENKFLRGKMSNFFPLLADGA